MAIYCVGDIHGCFNELKQLLRKIDFSPSTDTLYILGDLINRGANSVEVLRYLMTLEGSAHCILGNHDIHTLAVATGVRNMHQQDTISQILHAPDANILLHWLRHQPLALYAHQCLMVHAGVQPSWDTTQTMYCAGEVSQLLRNANWRGHLKEIFGNDPAVWSDDLTDIPRWRCILNSLTRMRMLNINNGAMDFTHKAAPSKNEGDLLPWYIFPQRRTKDTMLFFGHWATLGVLRHSQTMGLDSGCVWGGALTAVEISATGNVLRLIQVPSFTSDQAFKKP